MFIKDLVYFKKLVLLTILFIYLVILAGGIVRSTGSGMGCPDWPKCFGKWIPPTNISELPSNYKDKFKVGNHFIADFNAFKTWVEYTNRLLGAVLGIIVLVSFVYSFKFLKTNHICFLLSLGILLLTGFQGWIGAKVVSSNLENYMITIHMFIAILILVLALLLLRWTDSSVAFISSSIFSNILLILSLLTFVQILFGSQVRQEVDSISLRYNESSRHLWIGELSGLFTFHKVIAVIVLVLNSVFSFYFVREYSSNKLVTKLVLIFLACLFIEYLFGVIMVNFAIPFYTQPFHLMLSTLVFGLQFYVWLNLIPIKTFKVVDNLNLGSI